MPRQEKRARQKAARAARLAELERQRKRKAQRSAGRPSSCSSWRSSIGIIALAGGFSSIVATATTTTTTRPRLRPRRSTTTVDLRPHQAAARRVGGCGLPVEPAHAAEQDPVVEGRRR